MLGKFRHILVFLALASLSTSCLKWSEWDDETVQEVTYSLIDRGMLSTKATVAYPTSIPFVSYAWYLPYGKSWDADKSESELYINGAQISWDDTNEVWKEAGSHYWWPKLGNLTFVSVSPYSVSEAMSGAQKQLSVDNAEVTLTDWVVADNATTDVMVSNVEKSITSSSYVAKPNSVPTIFYHALSLIIFEVEVASGFEGNFDIESGSLKLSGLGDKATMTYDGSSINWSNTSIAFPDKTYNDLTTCVAPASDSDPDTRPNVLLIPQDVPSAACITVTYSQKFTPVGSSTPVTVPVTKPVSLDSIIPVDEADSKSKLLPGKKYLIKITFGANVIQMTGASEDWTANDPVIFP